MTNLKNNKPNYRFQGYTDAWELRKLGGVANFSKGNGYSKKDLVEEGSPIILYGRLYTRYETVISEIDTFVSDEENRSNAVFSEGGEVLVPASGESALDIARASVVSEKGIVLGGDLNIIRLISEISPIFLALTISNGKTQKELSKRAQGKSVVHLHNSDLKEVEFMVPTLPEQSAIGTFFSTLDKHITLHQRKLDTLKEQKKTYLKLLFPAKGQTKPALRFQGFEDDWEEARLGDLILTKSFKNFIRNPEGGGEFPVIQQGDIPIVGYSNGEPFKDFNSVVLFGDHTLSLFRPNTPFFVATDGVKILESKQFTGEFLYVILTNYRPESQGYKRHYTILKGTLISFTKNMKEQEAIGTFFQTLDQEMAQVEDKLASLKEMKKTLLRKLFVS